jgi:hypothetical protein
MRTWLRAASLGVAAGLWLCAQEQVDFDPAHDGPPTWQQEYVPILLAAMVLCGHWWFLSWFTRRRLTQTGWRATRVVWPTAAVALAWLAVLAGLSIRSEAVAGTLAAAAATVNLPLIPVACLAGWLSELGLPWWFLAPAGTAAAWFWWWAIIFFFERRSRNSGPVTLRTHLTS